MKNTDVLKIWEGEKQIILAMERTKYIGWHEDETGLFVDEFDNNQIEISYREDDENGWGIGSNEFISTVDIKSMAECIRWVVFHGKLSDSYSCQNNLFRIAISYNPQTDLFSFMAALLETLTREYHIAVIKEKLTRSALDEYILPFFEWEKAFPIVE